MLVTTERIDLEEMVGQKVRRIRERRGWSQAELGSRLGRHGHPMQQSTVAKLEAGSRPLRVNELDALARVFDIRPQQLVDDIGGSELLRALDRMTRAAAGLEAAHFDVEEAEARLARAQRRVDEAQVAYDEARGEYRSLVGAVDEPQLEVGRTIFLTGEEAQQLVDGMTDGKPGEKA